MRGYARLHQRPHLSAWFPQNTKPTLDELVNVELALVSRLSHHRSREVKSLQVKRIFDDRHPAEENDGPPNRNAR
jgi:hypothetical protein